jgi:hypothetical protein
MGSLGGTDGPGDALRRGRVGGTVNTSADYRQTGAKLEGGARLQLLWALSYKAAPK